jgi:hypothetical protein
MYEELAILALIVFLYSVVAGRPLSRWIAVQEKAAMAAPEHGS